MGGRLRNLVVSGSGLVAILGIGGGCETPGGAMLMSALGAASLAKGGTPKQMAMASAYKNIGDASLAYQASKREAEATESAGQNIGEGLRASNQGGYIIQQQAQPVSKVYAAECNTLLWKDYDGDSVLDPGEFSIQNIFKISDILNKGYVIWHQVAFNSQLEG